MERVTPSGIARDAAPLPLVLRAMLHPPSPSQCCARRRTSLNAARDVASPPPPCALRATQHARARARAHAHARTRTRAHAHACTHTHTHTHTHTSLPPVLCATPHAAPVGAARDAVGAARDAAP
eukprot:355620-Chlamydomonas_euryale.AAC.2